MYVIQLARLPTGNYAIPISSRNYSYYMPLMGAAIFRNGMLMTPDVDFITISRWEFQPNPPWGEDDIVSAIIQSQEG